VTHIDINDQNLVTELDERELTEVVGGDAALSHEQVHESHTPKRPLIEIAEIAILIGM
jgi:hypothetical protein